MIRPGVFRDTFEEAFRNQMFLFFFVIASLVIATVALAMNMDIVNGVFSGATLFGAELRVPRVSLATFVQQFQAGIAMLVGTVGLLTALLATSTLMPAMLQKGSIELLLCRPIPRWRILLARFAGGAMIMAFNAAYLILGVWLALGLKSGIWTTGFPQSPPLMIFAFVVLFAAMTMFSTITENGPVGLLVGCTLLMFSPVLAAHEQITPAFSREAYRQAFRTAYWILPKSAETIGAMRRLILGETLQIGSVVWTSALFAVVCLGITIVFFTRKDY